MLLKAALITVAVLSHIADFYTVGETRFSYPANIPSFMFVLAIAMLVAEHDLTPSRIRLRHPFFVISYNLVLMICMTSVAVFYVWLPLSLRVIQLNFFLAHTLSGLGLFQEPPLDVIINFMTYGNWQRIELTVIALTILLVVSKETGALEVVKTILNKMNNKCEEIGVGLYTCDCKKCTQEVLRTPQRSPRTSNYKRGSSRRRRNRGKSQSYKN